ncbi:hypothetical protein COCON_G00137990 [Conger conger]|uniref:Uncharacterized protein n=1 Tax=Conger conger TaxID=82655 RepID=A0A9Q1DF49_CONCO|nr:hypothetical protein COCON_G00137990 [Conger conger]
MLTHRGVDEDKTIHCLCSRAFAQDREWYRWGWKTRSVDPEAAEDNGEAIEGEEERGQWQQQEEEEERAWEEEEEDIDEEASLMVSMGLPLAFSSSSQSKRERKPHHRQNGVRGRRCGSHWEEEPEAPPTQEVLCDGQAQALGPGPEEGRGSRPQGSGGPV